MARVANAKPIAPPNQRDTFTISSWHLNIYIHIYILLNPKTKKKLYLRCRGMSEPFVAAIILTKLYKAKVR
jgi:hypothetical protein